MRQNVSSLTTKRAVKLEQILITVMTVINDYPVVYGRPELEGGVWTDVATWTYLSIFVEFAEPMRRGYLNRIQLYSVRRGINVRFQLFRNVGSEFGGTQFLVAAEFPYTTRLTNGFENTVSYH